MKCVIPCNNFSLDYDYDRRLLERQYKCFEVEFFAKELERKRPLIHPIFQNMSGQRSDLLNEVETYVFERLPADQKLLVSDFYLCQVIYEELEAQALCRALDYKMTALFNEVREPYPGWFKEVGVLPYRDYLSQKQAGQKPHLRLVK